MLGGRKQEIVTFKADAALLDAMRAIPNRSEFIRDAIHAALHGHCPLCGGSGVLTPEQWRHWREFEKGHGVAECGKCHAVHLVCESSKVTPDSHKRCLHELGTEEDVRE